MILYIYLRKSWCVAFKFYVLYNNFFYILVRLFLSWGRLSCYLRKDWHFFCFPCSERSFLHPHPYFLFFIYSERFWYLSREFFWTFSFLFWSSYHSFHIYEKKIFDQSFISFKNYDLHEPHFYDSLKNHLKIA